MADVNIDTRRGRRPYERPTIRTIKSPVLAAAVWWAHAGFRVLPLQQNGKDPATGLVPHAASDATRDGERLLEWFGNGASLNLGVALDGHLALDVEGEGHGVDGVATFNEMFGPDLVPDGLYVQRTPSGGMHIVGALPDGVELPKQTGTLAPGIEWRTGNTYVAVGPSYFDGPRATPPKTYQGAYKEIGGDPNKRFPVALVDRLCPPRPKARKTAARPAATTTTGGTPYGRAALEREVEDVHGAGEGNRRYALNAAAFSMGQLIAGGEIDEATVKSALYDVAEMIYAGVDRERDIRHAIEDGIADGMRNPRSAPEPTRPATKGNGRTEEPPHTVEDLGDEEPFEVPEHLWAGVPVDPTMTGLVVPLSEVVRTPVEYDAENLIRRHGLHMTYGLPGGYKTYVHLLMALQMTQLEPGEYLLGSPELVVRRRWRSVLWLGDEESAGELKNRAEIIARGHGLRPPEGREILFADASGGDVMLDLRHIPELVDDLGVDAVFADPLANLIPDTDGEGRPVNTEADNPHALKRVCRPLRRLCKQRDVSVFLIHHPNKGGEVERGPSAYRGSVDVLNRLAATTGGLIELECQKNRDARKVKLHFEPLWSGGGPDPFTLNLATRDTPPPGEDKLPKTAALMLAAIRARPLKRDDVYDAVPSVSRQTKWRNLNVLLDRNLVAKQADETYIATATATPVE